MNLDYEAEIDAKAWALLEAAAGVDAVFLPGCRLKDDVIDDIKLASFKAPADFGNIGIKVEADDLGLQNTPRTFGMNSVSLTSAVVDFSIPTTLRLVVTMFFDLKMTKAKRQAAENFVSTVWRKALPKFGLSYVSNFRITTARRRQRIRASRPFEVNAVVQTLAFNLRPKFSQLTA